MKNKDINVVEAIFNSWKKIVLEPPGNFIDLLIEKTVENTGINPSREDVRDFIKSRIALFPENTVLTPKQQRSMSQCRVYVDANNDGIYKGKKPQWFRLDGEKKKFGKSWRDLIVEVCETVASENPSEFCKILEGVYGGRPYFSKSGDSLKDGRIIKDTGIFVETNLSANNAKSLCDAIIKFFGYDESDFEISLWLN